MERREFMKKLKAERAGGNRLIGVGVGTGLTAKNAILGGADFILALNSGIFRQRGLGSLGGFMPYGNCNEMVAAFAKRELLPRWRDFPLIFGLGATDPTRDMEAFLTQIRDWGFTGVNNYPSVGLIDGHFREALEEGGLGFSREIEVMALASELGLAVAAYVFDANQARAMIEVGADIICAHLGLTQGGILGAAKVVSLTAGRERVQEIFDVCDELGPEVIKMVYGGPVKTPADVQYMYQNTTADGYIGGSVFDRIPAERSLIAITKEFKTTDTLQDDDIASKMVDEIIAAYDYVGYVKDRIKEDFAGHLSFTELAAECHLSRSYLSSLFHKEVGCSFMEYLVAYRMKKAEDLLEFENISIGEVATLVGYKDAAQFSKMFKKHTGLSPKVFRQLTRSQKSLT